MLLANLKILFALGVVLTGAAAANDVKAKISVQATNNTLVPSVLYIVDAVECLEEAFSIYGDDKGRATLYAALFEEKHNGTWNVVVGYSAFYVQSSIYVETTVSGEQREQQDSNKLFLIFSSD